MSKLRGLLVISTLLLAALTAHPSAQPTEGAPPGQAAPPQAVPTPRPGVDQPAVTFKVEVNYVEVDAAVFDKAGKFVGNLSKDDFQVFEDGEPQEISAFTLVNIPIERADRPLFATNPVPPDVVSNERPFDGRLYVLVLDDLHTAPLGSVRVRNAAKQFITRYMGDNDLAAVVHTSGKTTSSQDFTASKPLLIKSVDQFMGRSLESLTLSRLDQYQRDRSLPPGMTSGNSGVSRVKDPYDIERGYHARQSLDALKSISDWLASIRGRRKAIIFVSEGIDYDLTDFNNSRESSVVLESLKDAIAAATRSNVSIYSIDPRGLTTMGETSIEASGGFPEDPQYGLSPTSFLDDLRTEQQSLRSLAEDTGGYAAVNANDYAKAWDRVVADNSNYYVLGYYPRNDRRDGRSRKIEVRVRGEGLDVRYRKGYTAPKGKPPAPTPIPAQDKTSPEVRQALDSPVPLPGLTMRAYAAPFKGEGQNASVSIGVEAAGDDLAFSAKDGKFVNDVELSAIAIDAGGKIRDGDRTLLNMGLKPETRALVARNGLRIQSRLKLPPGRYQLRLAARESGGNHLGTLVYDLDVPNFTSEPLVMSGIVISAASRQEVITAKPDTELGKILPAPATATRTFPNNDTLAIFAEVYDNDLKRPHKVNITTTVLADDGKSVFSVNEQRESSEFAGSKSGGYGHMQQIPLKGLAPGLYVLRIEAKSTLEKGFTVSREVPFTVADRK